uniref:Uncharacterized protein n=1 Tax=Zea mays TaxID=4577 RepID=A0A804MGC3_MAIZE
MERTLFGFKDPVPDAEPASTGVEVAVAPFWNREKDIKVEPKQNKGNALNELIQLPFLRVLPGVICIWRI